MSDSEDIDREDYNRANCRVLRSRRYKRPFEDARSDKRLFTPEIKRHLKTWLIRRRENPYPNREEKKELAVQTGLTYIQICNWFANWRRKLKNAGRNVNKFTWSTLIKSYNNQIIGNLEHLSISSDDSIWEETEMDQSQSGETESKTCLQVEHCYTSRQCRPTDILVNLKVADDSAEPLPVKHARASEPLPQCFQISSTTDFIQKPKKECGGQVPVSNKSLKSNRRVAHRYLERRKKNARDDNWNYERKEKANADEGLSFKEGIKANKLGEMQQANSILLSKWRKSAACFRPNHQSYLIKNGEATKKSKIRNKEHETSHGREELDAAEALTSLSRIVHNKFHKA